MRFRTEIRMQIRSMGLQSPRQIRRRPQAMGMPARSRRSANW
jgi:hypothetical protein